MPEFDVLVHDSVCGPQWHHVVAADLAALAGVLGVDPAQVLGARPVAAKVAVLQARGFPLRLFSQELAVLMDAGIALLEALQTLHEKEQQAGVSRMLQALVAALRDGLPLSQAMAQHPAVFDSALRAVVTANERTGQLASALRQHAAWLGWLAQLRARLTASLAYPALLCVVGGLVIGFLLVFVLPRFAGVLDGLGQQLPWGTRQLIRLSVAVLAHPVASLAMAATLATGAGLLLRWHRARGWAVGLLWHLPWCGVQLRGIALARLYRTLGMLLASGVPVLQAIDIAQGVVAEPLRRAVRRARAHVHQGRSLSAAFEAEGLATAVARRMLRVGERSGSVAAMLDRAAAFHDEELERLSDFVTRILNPALMLVMGVVIGGIIVLMYLPIFQLVEQVQ